MALLASLYWGSGDSDALAKLQSTAAELDGRLSATESEIEQVGSLADRVAAVEAAPAASDAGTGELADRLADLEQQLGDLRETANLSTSDAAASEEAAAANAAVNEHLAALEQQLSELSQTVASSSEEQQSVSQALTSLQSALPTLESSLSATGTTVEENGQQTAMLGESVDTLRQTTEQLSGDLGGLSKDLGALSDRMGGAEDKLNYIGGEYQRAAAMVVAIGDVDRLIAKAEPFETALESLRALGQDDPSVSSSLQALQPMAAKGVPTLLDLKASFGAVGSQILLAEEGNATLADQVSDNLFGIINMRPAGAEVEGDDSRAIVARAQAKLSAGDIEGTIVELDALSKAAAERASGWVADAKARLAADAAIVDLRAHAQSLLAKGA
ncbi:MAG: mitofilin family membrane protein [Geminicoccaceae bacterium]